MQKDSLLSGNYTQAVSSWFSDSEPYREQLMDLSMRVKHYMGLEHDDEQITIHKDTQKRQDMHKGGMPQQDGESMDDGDAADVEAFEAKNQTDENAKIANAGIIIVGRGDSLRALMAFGGSPNGGVTYAEAVNKYYEEFGDKVNIYCMLIPTSIDFYCPQKVRKYTTSQAATITNIYKHLHQGIKIVNAYQALAAHVNEPIYLRTDHHWAPLGAYYAAQRLAQVAKVPFKTLDNYDKKIVHGYVGSMYGYSKDIAVKQAAEDFIYYTPRNVTYQTTYVDYRVNENFVITHESKPAKGPFFYKYRDGSAGAYCTFMGSDKRITTISTSTHNGRRVLIMKDSFGNALPGYLFYSFEEIHVIDSRYFNKNMVSYVRDNKITDILFANNIFKAYSLATYRSYLRFLKQSDKLMGEKKKQSADTIQMKNKDQHLSHSGSGEKNENHEDSVR